MTDADYLAGFGNHFESEAIAGALPVGRNSPQRPPLGLYAEKLSGTAFTAPRASNARSWLYRIRPSVLHGEFREVDSGGWHTAPLRDMAMPPNPLRWQPLPMPRADTDFVAGLNTIATNGDALTQTGTGVHIYCANASMTSRYLFNADGEMLLVPQQGPLLLHTEFGRIDIAPGQIAVIPRGVRFRVELPDGSARGYVCENYGARLSLPERGPIGSDGLANERDFETPVAAFEDREEPCELLARSGGRLFACEMDHSPLDVVAWHGNLVPYRYDLGRFNAIGSISYDHPDPSLFTVLSSLSDTPGTANLDFVVFPPRWMVAEDTFRPPWFHRNIMSEYMGLIYGNYDAKTGGGFAPGGASLHNAHSAHGPDAVTVESAMSWELEPRKLDKTLAFMFESRYPFVATPFALKTDARDRDYAACWSSIPRLFGR